MRRMFAVSLVFALLATLLPLSTAAAKADNVKSRGDTISARIQEEDGCIVNSTYVYASNTIHKRTAETGAPQTYRGVRVWVSVFDVCNFERIRSGRGYTELTEDQLHISESLSDASVVAQVPVTFNNNEVHQVAVDLAWTGYGKVERSSGAGQHKSDSMVITMNIQGEVREATVAGSVTSEAADFAVSATSANGGFYNIRSGMLTVDLSE